MRIILPHEDEIILTVSADKALQSFLAREGSLARVAEIDFEIKALSRSSSSMEQFHGDNTVYERAALVQEREKILRLQRLNERKKVYAPGSPEAIAYGMYVPVKEDQYGFIIRGGTINYGDVSDVINGQDYSWVTMFHEFSLDNYHVTRYETQPIWAPLSSLG